MKFSGHFVVPNLCKNSSVLMIVVFTELFAIIVSLLGGDNSSVADSTLTADGSFLTSLGVVSLYLQWMVLLSVALLCVFRPRLNSMRTNLFRVVGAIVCCFVSFFITELFSQYVINGFSVVGFDWLRLLSFSLIACICIGLSLRIFAIFSIIEQRNKSEMAMRIVALQSRIRPHFLFNSLNTISELTVVNPKQAEQAINSLSLLFRASLESDKRFHGLDNEISLCRRYLELEGLRLEDRLSVDWSIHVINSEIYQVPKLILQPIIENAVVHGLDEDGRVGISIDIRESKNDLSMVIENTAGNEQISKEGNGIAIDNIRERLFVLFDDRQTFRVKAAADSYSVLMRFPKLKIKDIGAL